MSNTLMQPMSAAEAVANGAQLLDEKQPGWWRNINLGTLDISKCEQCVCGQLAYLTYASIEDDKSRYMRFLNSLLGTRYRVAWALTRSRKDVTHGFGHSPDWSFKDLDREWAKVIKARVAADKLAADTSAEMDLELTHA